MIDGRVRHAPGALSWPRRLVKVAVTALVAVLFVALAPPARSDGLTTGFNPDPVLTGPSAWANPYWIDQAKAEGAGIVRVNLAWSAIAPAQRPPGFVADNPASPGYDWSVADAEITALTSQGLNVLINMSSAPVWAEGPSMPSGVRPGTWEPSPAQFAQFAQAAAERYSGRFPAPGHPASTLPRVRYWQAWNEPNLDTYLTPQWSRTPTGWEPASPSVYRKLLNGFGTAVKRVAPGNLVVSAGMAPYGNPPGVDSPGGYRISPITFDRQLFLRPVHLDVLAQNIYPIGGPLWHAYQPADVGAADLYKVAAVLRRAVTAGTALPRAHKQIWVTELGWNSRPPNPGGVPVSRQARWYEQALYTLWRQGVDTVLLLQLVDAPPVPSYAASYQTGLYYSNGEPKPAATAFRFPLVAERRGPRAVYVWGRAPIGGRLRIERANRRKLLASQTVAPGQVFTRTLHVRGPIVLQAQIGGQTSLTWTA